MEKVVLGEGNGNAEEQNILSIEDALDKIIAEADNLIENSEKSLLGIAGEAEIADDGRLTEILPGFPEKIEGEIVFCDADNVNTDGIYPGKVSALSMLFPTHLCRIE